MKLLTVVGLSTTKNTLEEVRIASKVLNILNLKGAKNERFDYPEADNDTVRVVRNSDTVEVVVIDDIHGEKNISLSMRNEVTVQDLLYIGRLI